MRLIQNKFLTLSGIHKKEIECVKDLRGVNDFLKEKSL